MTFMDDYLAGRTDGTDIEDRIVAWHNSTSTRTLHQWLGMTFEQYRVWFFDHTLPERGAP